MGYRPAHPETRVPQGGDNIGWLLSGLLMSFGGAFMIYSALHHDYSKPMQVRRSTETFGAADEAMTDFTLSWQFGFGALVLGVGLFAFIRAAYREYRLLTSRPHVG